MVDRANEGEALQDFANVIARRTAWANAGDEAAVFAHVVGEFRRIKDDADVEEREQDDEDDIDQVVERFAERDDLAETFHEGILRAEHECGGGGKREQRAGENRRDDAAGIDAQREIGRLAAHDAASDDALRILYRDAALAAFDVDDEGNDRAHASDQREKYEGSERAPCLRLRFFVKVENRARQTDDDADENDQRHTVANAAFGDLFAEPHDEGGASGQRENGHQDEANAGIENQRLTAVARALQRGGDRGGLNDAEDDGEVARVLRDLAAAELAFFLELFEVWEPHGHQLENDGCRDVRHDAERENRDAAEVAAAEQIEDPEERAGALLEEHLDDAPVDAGSRNLRTDAIHRQEGQREENAVPQIRDAEHVSERFEEFVHVLLWCPCLLLYFKTFQTGTAGRAPTTRLRLRNCRRPWRSCLWPTG